jgi:hypothetical protein
MFPTFMERFPEKLQISTWLILKIGEPGVKGIERSVER